jgi:hypothetical protein
MHSGVSRTHLPFERVSLGMLAVLRKSEEVERDMNLRCVPRKLGRTGAAVDAARRVATGPSRVTS